MNDHPHSRYSLDKRLAGQLAPALNGVFQPIDKSVSRSYKIRLKLAADGQLFLQACLFITFREKKKETQGKEICDSGHEFQSSAEAMRFVPDRKQKEATQLLMDRQQSNRWEALYCRCALYAT